MQRYAIVKDGVVVNVIEYESQPSTPPAGFEVGYMAIQSDYVGVGWIYANGNFTDPNPTIITEIIEPMSTVDRILENPTELAKLKAALGI